MTNTDKQQCTKRVYSGERIDFNGHRCTRNALPGEELCRQHYDIANPKPVEPADMSGTPKDTEHSGTLRTVMRWEPNEGPIIVSYGRRYFVRRLQIELPVYDNKRARAYLRADCALIKKDGTESLNYSSGDYVNEDQFTGEAAELIDQTIKTLEDIAEQTQDMMQQVTL